MRRYRFRRKGGADCYLPDPASADFEASYREALGYAPSGNAGKAVAFRPVKGVSYVYFVAARGEPIKIGVSIDLAHRLSRLQVSHYKPLHLLAVIEGGPDLEAEYHERFRASRLSGEWFSRSPELTAEIRAINLRRRFI